MCDRILIIRPGALGDFILTLPVIAGLRELYPNAWIEVLARGRTASLAEGIADTTGNLDTCRPLAAGGGPSDYIGTFGLVITWSSDSHSAYVPQGFGGEAVVLPAVPPDGVCASRFFFKSVPQLKGVEWEPPRVRLTSDECARADELLAANRLGGGADVVAVHPGSGGRGKCWPAESFARVISALLDAGRNVLMLQGEADAQAVADVRAELGGDCVPVLRDLPLRTLAAALSRCGRYLGNDSGVSHLAAAVQVECVVLFGPTDPEVWAPQGRNVTVLAADLECRPCGKTSPDCTDRRCLTDVTPGRVLAAMLK